MKSMRTLKPWGAVYSKVEMTPVPMVTANHCDVCTSWSKQHWWHKRCLQIEDGRTDPEHFEALLCCSTTPSLMRQHILFSSPEQSFGTIRAFAGELALSFTDNSGSSPME